MTSVWEGDDEQSTIQPIFLKILWYNMVERGASEAFLYCT
jgi:hypothetical protein